MRLRSIPAWTLRKGDVFLFDGDSLTATEDPQQGYSVRSLYVNTNEGTVGFHDDLMPVYRVLA